MNKSWLEEAADNIGVDQLDRANKGQPYSYMVLRLQLLGVLFVVVFIAYLVLTL